MIRGLIFDFDGLVLDTEVPAYYAWRDVYAGHGQALPFDAWALGIGTGPDVFDPVDYLSELVGRPLERTDLRRQYRALADALIAQERPRPGLLEYLAGARARGLGLAVASSSPRRWVVDHLDRLGLLDRFDAICCAEDVERVKPDPALYLTALSRLGLGANEAIAFEDSPNGILAAKRAGLYCVAVANPVTGQLDLGGADRRVESLAELPLDDLLASLVGT